MAIEVREMRVAAEEGLLLEESLLQKAHLGRQVRIVVQKGEIRLLPVEEDWIELLNDLAGCLGEEPAQNYDLKLKIGGFYEARLGRQRRSTGLRGRQRVLYVPAARSGASAHDTGLLEADGSRGHRSPYIYLDHG